MLSGAPASAGEQAPVLRPALRGVIHRHSVPVAVLLTVLLAVRASTGGARAVVIVYGACVVAMLTVSGIYHLPSLFTRDRRILRRLDHSTILLSIAGSYTAVIGLGMEGATRVVLLVMVWVIAAVGITVRMAWFNAPGLVVAVIYMGAGWFALVNPPAFFGAVDSVEGTMLVASGLLYTGGAAVFASGRPNPWPSKFGFHEIFHTCVVVAALFHWVTVYRLVG